MFNWQFTNVVSIFCQLIPLCGGIHEAKPRTIREMELVVGET
jgi:hypothetical protein